MNLKVEEKASTASLEQVLNQQAATLADKARAAATVSAVSAKLAWEKEAGVFVDLRETVPKYTIDGFTRIPASQLAKQLSKIEEAAKAAGTKDIYFLDLTGYQSGNAVNLLQESPQFAGYNTRAIQGGMGEWLADDGPYTVSNPDVTALLQKLKDEAAAENFNDQYYSQVCAEAGLGAGEHQMLHLPEGSTEVQEVPFDPATDKSFNQTAFYRFMSGQKTKL
jgi:rhodanese-related sulfurtransferase